MMLALNEGIVWDFDHAACLALAMVVSFAVGGIAFYNLGLREGFKEGFEYGDDEEDES